MSTEINHSGAADFDLDAIPVDDDTTVKSTRAVKVAGYPCALQAWTWDGVVAKSLIFKEADVASLSDSELKKLVKNSGFSELGGAMTASRNSSGFAFVNFDFVV